MAVFVHKPFVLRKPSSGCVLNNFREGAGNLAVDRLVCRRNRPALYDPSKWAHERILSRGEGDGIAADLFRLPNGRRVVARSDYALNDEQLDREVTRVLARAIASKVRMERPLAYLTGRSGGQSYALHVSSFVEGETLEHALQGASVEEKRRVTISALRYLKRMHDAGIMHGHPHARNIVIEARSGLPTFIDTTGLHRPFASIARKAAHNDLEIFAHSALDQRLFGRAELAPLLERGYGLETRAARLLSDELLESYDEQNASAPDTRRSSRLRRQ